MYALEDIVLKAVEDDGMVRLSYTPQCNSILPSCSAQSGAP